MIFQTCIWIFLLTFLDTLRNFSVTADHSCYFSYYYYTYYCYYYNSYTTSSPSDPGITPGVVVGSINGFFIIVVVVVVICVKKHQRGGVVILPSANVTSVNTVTPGHDAQPGHGPPVPDHRPTQAGHNPYGPPLGADPV